MTNPIGNRDIPDQVPPRKRAKGNYLESDTAKGRAAKTEHVAKGKRGRQEPAVEEFGEKKTKFTPKKGSRTTDALRQTPLAPLKRTRSAANIDTTDRAGAIAQLSGEFWECFERSPGDHGGYLYHFRVRPEFMRDLNAINEKMQQIAPAVEALPREDVLLIPSLQSLFENAPILEKLGYSYSDKTGVLKLPDLEALRRSWRALQLENPNLPDLDILPSDGIADDISFVAGSLTHDVILSTGKEFVHDHLFHVIAAIKLLSSAPKKELEHEKVIFFRIVLQSLRCLDWGCKMLKMFWPPGHDEVVSNNVRITNEDILKLQKCLGARLDEATAADSLADLKKYIEHSDQALLPHQLNKFGWSIVRDRLYGTTYDTLHLEEVWQELGRLEHIYLNSLKTPN